MIFENNLTKEQIINYMVDVLGYSDLQDTLELKTDIELWYMLSEEQQRECVDFNS